MSVCSAQPGKLGWRLSTSTPSGTWFIAWQPLIKGLLEVCGQDFVSNMPAAGVLHTQAPARKVVDAEQAILDLSGVSFTSRQMRL